jgi:hypothetical protein
MIINNNNYCTVTRYYIDYITDFHDHSYNLLHRNPTPCHLGRTVAFSSSGARATYKSEAKEYQCSPTKSRGEAAVLTSSQLNKLLQGFSTMIPGVKAVQKVHHLPKGYPSFCQAVA